MEAIRRLNPENPVQEWRKRRQIDGPNPTSPSPPGSPSGLTHTSENEENKDNNRRDLDSFSKEVLEKMKGQKTIEDAETVLKHGLAYYAELSGNSKSG